MNILEARAAESNWDERDPGSLIKPLKQAKRQPECHCAPPTKNRLGGHQPAIDRAAGVVRCRTCQKPIPARCKRRDVQHLRSLLQHPERTDWQSILDLLIAPQLSEE